MPAACAGGYLATARNVPFLPTSRAELLHVLHTQLLESVLDEAHEALDIDPARALMALRHITELLGLGPQPSPFA